MGGTLKWKSKNLADGKIHKLTGENSATYLYRTMYSPAKRKVTFLLGSDDTLSLWVNGKRLIHKEVLRGVKADEDVVEVTLKRGQNTILMKICNGTGGYGFTFRSKSRRGSSTFSAAAVAAFNVAPDKRNAKQKKAILDYYRTTDGELQKRLKAVAKEKKPLPEDPQVKKLKASLVMAQKPVVIEPKLVTLRRDVALSATQLKNRRLTMAQDVAWALINSPAFLFNR